MRACLSIHAHSCNELKWTSASALVPSAGLTSRKKNPTPFPSEGRFQASPVQIHHPTPSRGKRLRGSPASPPTPTEEGGRNLFHRLGVECPWSGMLTGVTLPCVFLVRRTLLTPLLPLATASPIVISKLRILPCPTGGKDQVGNRLEKGVVQQRSFKTPSKSSAADPLG